MVTAFKEFVNILNIPIVNIGQTQVSLGGIFTAVFVFLVSLIISKLVQRALTNSMTKKLKLTAGMAYAVKRILHYVIVFFGAILAAQCVGLNLGSLAVVFGFISVGIGFGLQNVTSNFISGLILLIERPVSAGDFVSVENQMGRVANINMRSTTILTTDNISIIVPNSKFIENPVINWSYGDTRIRLHCPVGVAYGSDITKVRETLLQVAKENPDVLKKPEPEVRFLEFANSSLNLELLAWTDEPEKQFLLHSKINYAIDQAFRLADIKIPFPQRDINLQMTPAIEKISQIRKG
ncbi:MAG: mechanosensitive ion channel [Candidatus Omnitrophica bacterium]|nr:mechanosensitive ion channel [Candidatus Omnitrophota bacterium]